MQAAVIERLSEVEVVGGCGGDGRAKGTVVAIVGEKHELSLPTLERLSWHNSSGAGAFGAREAAVVMEYHDACMEPLVRGGR